LTITLSKKKERGRRLADAQGRSLMQAEGKKVGVSYRKKEERGDAEGESSAAEGVYEKLVTHIKTTGGTEEGKNLPNSSVL